MDYNDSRLDCYYCRWVFDDELPPRQVFTSPRLNHEQFQKLIDQSRDPDSPITIISVVSILKYPYDLKGISDRRLMIKK